MDITTLKRFAQSARTSLYDQVKVRLRAILNEASLERRNSPDAVKALSDDIAKHGEDVITERAAYTWFNRFCALRFMDANNYHVSPVVSPLPDQTQPSILADAKAGSIDARMVSDDTRQKVNGLLSQRISSNDPQGDAYRCLLIAVCNYWHKRMPFLFNRIDDYTGLLMPGNLLAANSILSETCSAMTKEACQDVEVIGWLYQFYISEKKDAVFEGFKKNVKATPETIPAATQLFTPHWIVQYLVENSLGRLWMLNHPNSLH